MAVLDFDRYNDIIDHGVYHPTIDDELCETPFKTRVAIKLSVKSYVMRVIQYAYCSEEAYIISLIYLNRLHRRYGNRFYNYLTFHRLYITSILIASKFIDDMIVDNSYYAKVGGIPTSELCLLELTFLEDIDYELYVSEHEYLNCLSKVQRVDL